VEALPTLERTMISLIAHHILDDFDKTNHGFAQDFHQSTISLIGFIQANSQIGNRAVHKKENGQYPMGQLVHCEKKTGRAGLGGDKFKKQLAFPKEKGHTTNILWHESSWEE
jgi:hypothetical protein